MPLAIVSPRSAPFALVQAGVVLLLAASLAACGSSGGKERGPARHLQGRRALQDRRRHLHAAGRIQPRRNRRRLLVWPGLPRQIDRQRRAPTTRATRTAAHRTLQMPSIVRVTNLDNGLSTVVRINDRGPFARSRVIDLSRTAAQELDIVRNGTARVRIEQLQAESLAVKDVAINGGGPAEQQAAVAQVVFRPAPAPAQRAASRRRLSGRHAPPPAAPAPVYAQPAPPSRYGRPISAAGRRAGAGLRSGRKRRADRGLARQRHDAARRRAASMCRPAPSRRRRTPNASAAR